MGNPFRTYINSNHVWSCSKCSTHLTDNSDIVSKQFHGQHGRGYLFAVAANVTTGKHEHRTLSTGRHIVCDIHCRSCDEVVGWKYIKAYVPSEQYKVDKFLLERARICRDGNWAEHYNAQEKEIVA